MLDLDGVLLRGESLIARADEALARVRASGCRLAVVTNNAARTVEQTVAVLDRAGLTVQPSEVVSSPQAAAALLAPGTRCLVIGAVGLREALRARGCEEVTEPSEAQAVVVGLDRELVWDDLRRATLALRAGARFLATNADPTFPSPEGLWPGNGAIVAALQTASDRVAEVAGKPGRPLLEEAARRLGVEPLLLVGDRVDTDIAGAAAMGWDSALVLTGVTDAAAARAAAPAPTHVADSLAALLETLRG